MPIKTPQVVSPLPLPPNPADRSTFNTRAYPWSEALAPWTDQVNQLGADTLENAQSAHDDAVSADASKNAAAGSASTASTDAGLALGYKNAAYDSQQAAAGSASTANTASGQSVTARDLARQWASDTTVVADGLKGARGYAQDAAQSAADASSVVLGEVFDNTQESATKGWTSSKIVAWVASWWGGISSVTPAASKAVVSKSDGKIDSGWLDTVGSGKVMREGAHGLGGNSLAYLGDLHLITTNGNHFFGGSSLNIPSFVSPYGTVQRLSASTEETLISYVACGYASPELAIGFDNGAGITWAVCYTTYNTTKSPDGTLKASTVSNMAITRTGDNITRITEDGVQTNITYNADGTVNTMVYPQGGKTRTETFTYSSGRLTGMTATEV